MAHALVEIKQGQLGAGIRALAADDDPSLLGQAWQVDQAGELGDVGALS
ncbi:hypothetical protein ABZX69_36080 [Streptomyces sp. NPDC004074]